MQNKREGSEERSRAEHDRVSSTSCAQPRWHAAETRLVLSLQPATFPSRSQARPAGELRLRCGRHRLLRAQSRFLQLFRLAAREHPAREMAHGQPWAPPTRNLCTFIHGGAYPTDVVDMNSNSHSLVKSPNPAMN